MICIFNKYDINNLNSIINYRHCNIMVRITNPESKFSVIDDSSCFKDIIELKFIDVDVDGGRSFNRDHRDLLIHFFENNEEATDFYVHCDAGISRSSAVACGYCMYKKDNNALYQILSCMRFKPNKLILDAFVEYFSYNKKGIDSLYNRIESIRYRTDIYRI